MYGSFYQSEVCLKKKKKRVRTPRKKKGKKERTVESLIGFSFFLFFCRISHDRSIRKKNLYDDNERELGRKDQSF